MSKLDELLCNLDTEGLPPRLVVTLTQEEAKQIAELLRAGQEIRAGIACEEDEFGFSDEDSVVAGCEAWDAALEGGEE
jgi:hypothetical protein